MTRKIVLCAAVVFVALIIVLWIVVAVVLNSDALGEALLAEVSKATDLRLTADEFDLGIFSGLEMAGVTAEGATSAGEYRVELKRLVFKHRLWPLLSGTLAVDRIVLDQPNVLFVSRRTGVASGEADVDSAVQEDSAPADGGGFRFEVAKIQVIDGHIRLQTPSNEGAPQDSLVIEGMAITLESIRFDPEPESPVQRFSGKGTVAVERVLAGELPMRDLDGEVVAGEGVVELTGLSLSMDQGEVQATLRMDLNPVPFQYELSAQADPINVNQIVGLGDSGSLGPGRLELKGHGEGPESRDLQADGVLHLENGQIPSHPILEQVQEVVGIQHLVGGEYKATDAHFEVSDNRVGMDGFALESALAGLDIGGWADLDGPLQMRIGLRTPREGLSIPKVPPVVLDTLADEKGWVTVPLLVTGTLENPLVVPDMDALKGQGIRGVTRTLENLFGGSRSKRNR